ncbi:NUDIX domain-containing protein [Streptomyces sp. NPDC058280]|uniref:NUDIX domain-containing protein n=1 Tax=Streptomyces sp. NPDC058280 TaxID=3346419 RepID=UPI0036ED70D1
MPHIEEYFRTPPRRRSGALVALRNPQGNLLLVKKQYQMDEGNPRPWGMVGGSADATERPRAAFTRTVAEETGLQLQPGRLLVIDHVRASNRYAEGTNFVYDSDGAVLPPDTTITLPADLAAYQFVAPAELDMYLSDHSARRARAVLTALADGTTLELEDGYPVG